MAPQSATLGDWWRAVYARRWWIVALGIAGMLGGSWISQKLPPVYRAKATFFVPSNLERPTLLADTAGQLAQGMFRAYPEEREVGLVVGVLTSDDLAAQVLRRFPQRDAGPLRRRIDLSTSPQFYNDVFVSDSDPQLAADVANAFVDAFRDFHSAQLRAAARDAAAVLGRQFLAMQERLARKTAQIRAFQTDNRMLSVEETAQRFSAQLSELEFARAEIHAELQVARARLGAAAIAALPAASAPEPVANPQLASVQRLLVRQAAIDEQLARLRASASQTISGLGELQMLRQEQAVLQSRLTGIELRLAEARLQAESAEVPLVVVQRATPPATPGFPIAGLNAFIGLVTGLFGGSYACLLLTYLQRQRAARRQPVEGWPAPQPR